MPVLRALFADGGISPVLEHGENNRKPLIFPCPPQKAAGREK
jgi:hypothetical protein